MLDPKTDIGLRNQILTYHLSEVLTDVERAKVLGLPEGCRIRERAKILCPEKLKLGKNVWIGEGAVLDAQGGLTIGDNTQIGLNVLVWSHTSHKQAIEGKTGSLMKEGIRYQETKIGDNCFVGGPSVIGPGVTIGNGVIIAPLTFVDRDISDGEVVSAPRELKKLAQKVERMEELLNQLRNQFAALEGRSGP
jgi:acetyltransferase-like isoleucine patch superfamily enzyme